MSNVVQYRLRPSTTGGATRARTELKARLTVLRNRIVTIALIMLFWELAAGGFGAQFAFLDPVIVAPPSAALLDLIEYARSGLFWTDVESTFLAAFLGLAIGFVGGALAGIICGFWKGFADTLEPIFVALNSLPRVAVAPLLLMWLGLGLSSKIAVSAFSVFFVVFFNAFLGTRAVDPDRPRHAGDGRQSSSSYAYGGDTFGCKLDLRGHADRDQLCRDQHDHSGICWRYRRPWLPAGGSRRPFGHKAGFCHPVRVDGVWRFAG